MELRITLSQEPGLSLYNQVKAGFAAQGMSFAEGCRGLGIARENAKRALFGSWNGPAGKQARQRIIEAAGFTAPEA